MDFEQKTDPRVPGTGRSTELLAFIIQVKKVRQNYQQE